MTILRRLLAIPVFGLLIYWPFFYSVWWYKDGVAMLPDAATASVPIMAAVILLILVAVLIVLPISMIIILAVGGLLWGDS